VESGSFPDQRQDEGRRGSSCRGDERPPLFLPIDILGTTTPIYAGARLLEILTVNKRNMADLLADVPVLVNTPEIRLDCPDEKKFGVVSRLAAEFKKEYQVIDVDGARVLFDGGWGLIRSSNTQPVLVLRFEATDHQKLEEIRRIFMEKLDKAM